MASLREEYETGFASTALRQPEPEERAKILALADVCDEAIRNGVLSPASAELLEGALGSTEKWAFCEAPRMVGSLSCFLPLEVACLVQRLSSRADGINRCNALTCLVCCELTRDRTSFADNVLSEETLRTVLLECLFDTRPGIRQQAAELVERLDRRELLPRLLEAAQTETDTDCLKEMEITLALMQAGFHFEEEPDMDGGWLRVRHLLGYTTKFVNSRQIRTQGFGKLSARIRKKAEKRYQRYLQDKAARALPS